MTRRLNLAAALGLAIVTGVVAWKLIEELIGAAISTGINGNPWGDLP